SDSEEIGTDDVFDVWSCKAVQNNKALLSKNLFDGMYYELTLNGDKKEVYGDADKKRENKCLEMQNQLITLCPKQDAIKGLKLIVYGRFNNLIELHYKSRKRVIWRVWGFLLCNFID